MEKRNLQVGQTVWLNEYRKNSVFREVRIKKIGKKYFEVEGYFGRFYIETLKQDGGNYISSSRIYLSKEQYDDEIEANKIYSQLRDVFSAYRTNLTLTQLKQIQEIINS